jgi:hypothetical protein
MKASLEFPIHFLKIYSWELFDADHGIDLARHIRRYYIPNFSDWQADDSFETLVAKLIDDLRLDRSHA